MWLDLCDRVNAVEPESGCIGAETIDAAQCDDGDTAALCRTQNAHGGFAASGLGVEHSFPGDDQVTRGEVTVEIDQLEDEVDAGANFGA